MLKHWQRKSNLVVLSILLQDPKPKSSWFLTFFATKRPPSKSHESSLVCGSSAIQLAMAQKKTIPRMPETGALAPIMALVLWPPNFSVLGDGKNLNATWARSSRYGCVEKDWEASWIQTHWAFTSLTSRRHQQLWFALMFTKIWFMTPKHGHSKSCSSASFVFH